MILHAKKTPTRCRNYLINLSNLAKDTNDPKISLWKRLIHFLHFFNLFQSKPPSTNEFDLRNQRISTRLFLISLILSVTVLVVHTSLVNVTRTTIITTPSLSKYSELYSKYSQVLMCPCTKVSSKYKEFLHINYTLHQVCSSVFVNKYYIKRLLLLFVNKNTTATDFLRAFPSTLHALASLCQLMEKILSGSLAQFYSSQYVSSTITPEQLFLSQTHLAFRQFVLSRINALLLSMNIIRDSTQANGLLSGSLTNYKFALVPRPDAPEYEVLQPVPVVVSNCSCFVSVTCVEKVVLYGNEYGGSREPVFPDFYFGCFVLEGLLRSSLQCFYNQTCINTVEYYITLSSPLNVKPLDSSLPSRHNVSSTVQELVNELMVEDWHLTIIYKDYYDACQPKQCSYTYAMGTDVVYLTSIVIGSIGGLVAPLKLFIPLCVRFIAYLISRRRRVSPQHPIAQS